MHVACYMCVRTGDALSACDGLAVGKCNGEPTEVAGVHTMWSCSLNGW